MLKKYLAPLTQFLCALLFSSHVHAQGAGDFLASLGVSRLMPTVSNTDPLVSGSDPYGVVVPLLQSNLNGASASIGGATPFSMALAYFLTDHLAGELQIGYPPKLNVSFYAPSFGADNNAISANALAPVAQAKYFFFDPQASIRPYLGLGVTYISFTGVSVSSDSALYRNGVANQGAKMDAVWSPVLSAGALYALDRNWSVGAGVTYVPMKTVLTMYGSTPEAGATTSTSTTLRISAMEYGLKLGYRF
ncbi:OmpW family protein [Polynucleobacter sp.]|jgi:outer membrane protein|uniref:OmpW family protein n=1 Tax=Polynucleobacter sp. TaxID=2029855 RepID=UPI0037C9340D